MRFICTPTTHPFVSRAVEADIEVIDDLQGEAQEIAQVGNTWCTYEPPMQLARVRPLLLNYRSQMTTRMSPPLRRPILCAKVGVWYDGPNH